MSARRTVLPIRHFSPAVARRVGAALDMLEPDVVLVEGPSDWRDIAALTHEALEPPVALFAHVSTPPDDATGAYVRHTGWYPFPEFAPELAALRWAARRGVPARFVDIPSYARVIRGPDLAEPAGEPLEQALRTARARDRHELWDACFETRRDEPVPAFFERVHAYGAWLRSLVPAAAARRWRDRESFMAAKLRAAREGRAVLLCGASHVGAVEAALAQKTPAPKLPAPPAAHRGLHLTAYSDAQLAQIGDPPAYSRACLRDEDAWLKQLGRAARAARASELPVSTADLVAAAELAERLARFRGRPSPTRADVRDAIRSAWAQGPLDEERNPLLVADAVFIGDRVGRPASATDPPLVSDVRARLKRARFPSAAAAAKEARLRPIRSARDRERAQLLQRLAYLEIPYASQETGPRYLEGEDLDRVEQRWQLEWGPDTERVLVERASLGPTLREAAVQALRERIQASPPTAVEATSRVVEALALGLHDLLESLFALLRAHIDTDPQLGSVLAALHHLWLLHRYRDALGGVSLPALEPYLARAWSRALTLLGDLPRASTQTEPEALAGLKTLELVSREGPSPIAPEPFVDGLERTLDLLPAAPGAHVASRALLWMHGRRPLAEIIDAIGAHMAEADRLPDAAGRAFMGLFTFARRAYLDHPLLLGGVAIHVRTSVPERFLCALPEMRRAHATLTPWETSRLASEIKRRYGGGTPTAPPPEPLAQLAELEAAVDADLVAWWPRMEGTSPTRSQPSEPAQPSEASDRDPQMLLRWRLILGRFADPSLPLAELAPTKEPMGAGAEVSAGDAAEGDARLGSSGDVVAVDGVLGFLFDREYRDASRGMRTGGRGESQLTVPRWIHDLHRLFPRAVYERVEQTALERYGLTELVTDPDVLERLEPSVRLLDAVLRLKGHMEGRVLDVARKVVRRVADELSQKLKLEVELRFGARRGLVRYTPRGRHRDFAAVRTIARNLKSYDPSRRRLVVERPWFATPHEPRRWRVIVCVDQSASMLDSVVHASVVASVLTRVRQLEPHLVAFDTDVVDLTAHLDDPVGTLMSVQLGGGTDIAHALRYCASLVEDPRRTLVVLITDLYEGGDPKALEARVAALLEDGAKVLVLASLDDREGLPAYDREMARRLARLGAEIAALSPTELVRFVAEVTR